MNWREATVADADKVAALANAHELSVDKAASTFGHEGALSLIKGYVDPCTARLFFENETLVAMVNLHPDSIRCHLAADVYVLPGSDLLQTAIDEMEAWAKTAYPSFEIRPGTNVLDAELRSAYLERGYQELRIFWTMRRPIDYEPMPEIPAPYRLERIDISDEQKLRQWHAAHLNAFANHFGFVPRPFENWRDLVVGEPTVDKDGVFLVFEGERVVAYVECNFEYADDQKGYIALVGVVDDRRGLGLGELALRVGLARSTELGFKTVELNVDSGNESGALRLYEKLGFRSESAWIQFKK